jgi:hypothetical protein
MTGYSDADWHTDGMSKKSKGQEVKRSRRRKRPIPKKRLARQSAKH